MISELKNMSVLEMQEQILQLRSAHQSAETNEKRQNVENKISLFAMVLAERVNASK